MKIFFLFLLVAASLLPTGVGALDLNLDYPAFGPFDLNVNQSLAEIIGFFYYFIVGTAGLAAFVMLVWGGVQWLASGAIPSQAAEAKDKIRNAILGLLLILASFLIIQVINPELTILSGAPYPPIDCSTLGGACNPLTAAAPQPGVALTADGQPDLLCIQTSTTANVQLQWIASGVSGCVAASAPNTALWSGSKNDSGNESVVLSAGISDFLLSCAPFSDGVKVNVTGAAGAGCTGGTPITVDLKVRDSGDPAGSGTDTIIVFSPIPAENQIPSGSIALDWTSSPDTATCDTNGGPSNSFFAIGRPANGTATEMISLASPGTYTYTITCVDTTGTQSAPPDSVMVEVRP